MLRLKNLASGSKGNATVVEGRCGSHSRRLLMDCGLGIRQLTSRLDAAGLQLSEIDALFLTHEHSDHTACLQPLLQRTAMDIWMSAGTYAALGEPALGPRLRLAQDGEIMDLETFEALPFRVPHDAREPLQLRCTDGQRHAAIATDLGHVNEHVLQHLQGCHALMIEANHDPQLLAASAYPLFLQRRIAGPLGHLSNADSAQLLAAVAHPGLEHVIAAHLSERNNSPELARQALANAWSGGHLGVAHPREGTEWVTV